MVILPCFWAKTPVPNPLLCTFSLPESVKYSVRLKFAGDVRL